MVKNTLTKEHGKVPFVPLQGNVIRWYSCGPTVYDAAHMGHARNYVTFDIIRRILSDYFKYDITYVMNITDIDDKIILRARQAHLVEQFIKENSKLDDALKIKTAIRSEDICSRQIEGRGGGCCGAGSGHRCFQGRGGKAKVGKGDSFEGSQGTSIRRSASDYSPNSKTSSPTISTAPSDTLSMIKQSFVPLLLIGNATFWRTCSPSMSFHPDHMTRVSEYIPEIIAYVQRIISNGFGYVADGSVYFDVASFSKRHHYARLCPSSAGNSKFFEEGEGALGMKLTGKRDPRDFALWKQSKPGEPRWPSPWGDGRPGWHIECSAMASAVMPGRLDIHSGGIDLAFPHHDNEMAQAEAFLSDTEPWVNYFLHAGHVHIDGLEDEQEPEELYFHQGMLEALHPKTTSFHVPAALLE